jgi:hypothetical protein
MGDILQDVTRCPRIQELTTIHISCSDKSLIRFLPIAVLFRMFLRLGFFILSSSLQKYKTVTSRYEPNSECIKQRGRYLTTIDLVWRKIQS